jgi:hypothetical protein
LTDKTTEDKLNKTENMLTSHREIMIEICNMCVTEWRGGRGQKPVPIPVRPIKDIPKAEIAGLWESDTEEQAKKPM